MEEVGLDLDPLHERERRRRRCRAHRDGRAASSSCAPPPRARRGRASPCGPVDARSPRRCGPRRARSRAARTSRRAAARGRAGDHEQRARARAMRAQGAAAAGREGSGAPREPSDRGRDRTCPACRAQAAHRASSQPSGHDTAPSVCTSGSSTDAEALVHAAAALGHQREHVGGAGAAVVLDEVRVLLGEAGAADAQPAAAGRVEQLPGRAALGARVVAVGFLKVEPNVLMPDGWAALRLRAHLGERRLHLLDRRRRELEGRRARRSRPGCRFERR